LRLGTGHASLLLKDNSLTLDELSRSFVIQHPVCILFFQPKGSSLFLWICKTVCYLPYCFEIHCLCSSVQPRPIKEASVDHQLYCPWRFDEGMYADLESKSVQWKAWGCSSSVTCCLYALTACHTVPSINAPDCVSMCFSCLQVLPAIFSPHSFLLVQVSSWYKQFMLTNTHFSAVIGACIFPFTAHKMLHFHPQLNWLLRWLTSQA